MLTLYREEYADFLPDESHSVFSAEVVGFPTRCLEQLRRGHVQLLQDLWEHQRKFNELTVTGAKRIEIVTQRAWVEHVTSQLEQLERDIAEMSRLRDAAIKAVVEFKADSPDFFRSAEEEGARSADNWKVSLSAQANLEAEKAELKMALF